MSECFQFLVRDSSRWKSFWKHVVSQWQLPHISRAPCHVSLWLSGHSLVVTQVIPSHSNMNLRTLYHFMFHFGLLFVLEVQNTHGILAYVGFSLFWWLNCGRGVFKRSRNDLRLRFDSCERSLGWVKTMAGQFWKSIGGEHEVPYGCGRMLTVEAGCPIVATHHLPAQGQTRILASEQLRTGGSLAEVLDHGRNNNSISDIARCPGLCVAYPVDSHSEAL